MSNSIWTLIDNPRKDAVVIMTETEAWVPEIEEEI